VSLFKPARSTALEGSTDDDLLCDLDLVTTQRAKVVLHGKTHYLLPVTTQVYLDFWKKCSDFQKVEGDVAKDYDVAYHEAIGMMCKTITLDDVKRMTLMQRTILIESLCAKVIGDKSVYENAKDQKKKMTHPGSNSRLLN